ncbi:MAG: polysaccharide biosynthesis C-terminal domain-containing protein, partial [Clostridia bacterium]|nr:polysaccharide biosynthesis C-terminal domain-containing protein [Clostridia bacterium]
TGVIQGMGRQKVPVYFLIAGGALKVISMVVLMKCTNLGVLGAAISTVLCYVVAGIGDTIYTINHANMKVRWFDTFGKPLLSAAAMGAVVYFAYSFINKAGHPTLATLGSVVLGVIVYAACLWVLRAFNKDDLGFMPGSRKLAKLFRVNMK